MKSVMTALSCLGAFLALAGHAWAGPVSAPPATFSQALSERFEDDYGPREAEVLQRALREALEQSLADVGASLTQATDAPIVIDVTIRDVRPNRPTFAQLGRNVSLSYAGSIALGGADLAAVIRAADGSVLAEVEHRSFEDDIRWVLGAGTWSATRREIRRFAVKVARAYAPFAAHDSPTPTS